jgi:hypothetical protein
MALFGLNIFDQLTGGQWTDTSSCGFNKECKAAKACIANVCTPARALYGESVYNPCVQQCQREPRPASLEQMFCTDPKNAFEVWGYQCPGYIPEPPSGLKIGKTNISWPIVAGFVILIVVLLLMFWK